MNVSYQKAKTKQEAYDLVKARITPEYIQKWKVTAELVYEAPNKIIAKGKGFTLNMSFSDSACTLDVELGLLLKPLKGMISDEIKKQIEKTV
jgi:hypothetical protein